MKTEYRRAGMSASPIHVQKRFARSASVAYPLLRHLNMGTLALVLFVALALLSTTRGKEPSTSKSAPARAPKADIIIDNIRSSPETFMIPGVTVTWTTDSQVQQSPVLKTGQSFSDTFATAGNYSYLCAIQPRLTEKTIVR
jgi:plastocyanin